MKPRLLALLLLLFTAGVGAFFIVRQNRPHWFDAEESNPAAVAALADAKLTAELAPGDAGWPQFLGPTRNGVAPPGPLRTDWAAHPPKVLWTAPCGGGYAAISVANGRAYVLELTEGREHIRCLDAETGAAVWDESWPADYARIGYPRGPRAAPTVHGDSIFCYGATGFLTCRGLDGKEKWSVPVAEKFGAPTPPWGFASSPLVDGPNVIVLAGGKGWAVHAFDRTSGRLSWTAGRDVAGYSSAVAATLAGRKQIVAVTGEAVLGLDPADGAEFWRHDWKTANNGNIAAPQIVGDYVFVSSNYSKGCTLLHATPTGVEVVYAKPNRLMRNHHSTSVHRDGFLYGFDNDELKCVDLRKGVAVEGWEARDADNKAPAKGGVILAGDKLIGLTQTGDLFLADADPVEFKLRGSSKAVLTGPECWAAPSLVNGRIYLRDQEKIVCLDVR